MFYCGALGAIENGVPQLKRFYTSPEFPLKKFYYAFKCPSLKVTDASEFSLVDCHIFTGSSHRLYPGDQ